VLLEREDQVQEVLAHAVPPVPDAMAIASVTS